MVIVISLAVLFLLYILSTRGRTGHPEMKHLQGWNYAHRGLHDAQCPENSMAAFRKAFHSGYGSELDVHLLTDGKLAVIHDSDLKRTTGIEGVIEDFNAEDLKLLRLEGTDETVPEFHQVLDLYRGKIPLIIELKPLGNNYVQLCEKVCSILDGYKGPYCLESFDPRCIRWLKAHRPDFIRGQLVEDYFKSGCGWNPVVKFLMKNQALNFLTSPDFVAYRCSDRKTFSNFLVRSVWRVQGVTWTLKSREEYDDAVNEGWIPIFEGFRP